VQVTVHASLAPASTELNTLTWNDKIWNFETSEDVLIWRSSWDIQCDTLVPLQKKWHMVLRLP
jgi:hypothetical protein